MLRRAHFGRSSERLSEDQIALALEDVEAGFAAEDAKAEKQSDIVKRRAAKSRRANRGHLPAHLPREEIIIEPECRTCLCGGAQHVIGEDVSERLDRIPARLRIIVTRRPKYACRACTDGVVQAPAPLRLIEGGLPTDAFVADVLISKYAQTCLPSGNSHPAMVFTRKGGALTESIVISQDKVSSRNTAGPRGRPGWSREEKTPKI